MFTLVRLRCSPGFGFLICWLVVSFGCWIVCVAGCYFSGSGFAGCGSNSSFVVDFNDCNLGLRCCCLVAFVCVVMMCLVWLGFWCGFSVCG